MRNVQRWEEGEFSPKRPLVFSNWPHRSCQPFSFPWKSRFVGLAPGSPHSARLCYEMGWTALIFWNHDLYFVDETLTFDAMIGLLRERCPERTYLSELIERDFDHADS